MAVCVDRSGKETLVARWSRHVGRAKTKAKIGHFVNQSANTEQKFSTKK
jgi:hypothetical protein